ncbi:MAG: hypothetical protein H6891_08140 [Brucellaceae bacterium]|nr:hypothetical protein [Brucellaceae bacterium]
MGSIEVVQLAMFIGAMGSALMLAVWLIRERARTAKQNEQLRGRIAELDASSQRFEAFAALRNQRAILWDGNSPKPDVIGALPDGLGVPADRSGFLAFGRWIVPTSAARLERAINALRNSGTRST